MSIQEKFKAILANQAFDELVSYMEPMTWDTMSHHERELLGILFVKQGELQMRQGDKRVLESFELASRIASHSPFVFFQQALSKHQFFSRKLFVLFQNLLLRK